MFYKCVQLGDHVSEEHWWTESLVLTKNFGKSCCLLTTSKNQWCSPEPLILQALTCMLNFTQGSRSGQVSDSSRKCTVEHIECLQGPGLNNFHSKAAFVLSISECLFLNMNFGNKKRLKFIFYVWFWSFIPLLWIHSVFLALLIGSARFQFFFRYDCLNCFSPEWRTGTLEKQHF